MLWVITRPWFWSLIKDYTDVLWSESQQWSQNDAQFYSSTNWTELNLKRPVSLLFLPGCSLIPPKKKSKNPPSSQTTPQWRAGTNPIPALAPPWNPQDPEDTPLSVWRRRTFRSEPPPAEGRTGPRGGEFRFYVPGAIPAHRRTALLILWPISVDGGKPPSYCYSTALAHWLLFYFQLLRIRHSLHKFFKIKGPARA